MGQGHYIAVVYGGTSRPKIKKDDWEAEEAFSNAAYELGLRTAYESTVPWVGARIAGDQGMGDVSIEYTAMDLTDLPAWIEKHAKGPLGKARKAWEKLRKKYPDIGEARLLLVADYD